MQFTPEVVAGDGAQARPPLMEMDALLSILSDKPADAPTVGAS